VPALSEANERALQIWPDVSGICCGGIRLTPPGGARARHPALFLDRDGLPIEEGGYLRDPGKARLLPTANDLLARPGRSWATVVATNRSGVGRGY